ncbi:hypothetical protein SESBI_19177 [Sesbania bispinosa]|nr:hypothetical protein SESBI_19177 [Sesbania bispinosa]
MPLDIGLNATFSGSDIDEAPLSERTTIASDLCEASCLPIEDEANDTDLRLDENEGDEMPYESAEFPVDGDIVPIVTGMCDGR